MTHEQNIIAAAVDLMMTSDSYHACLDEFDPGACSRWAEAETDAIGRLGTALRSAGLDWRNPVIRDRLLRGQLIDILAEMK